MLRTRPSPFKEHQTGFRTLDRQDDHVVAAVGQVARNRDVRLLVISQTDPSHVVNSRDGPDLVDIGKIASYKPPWMVKDETINTRTLTHPHTKGIQVDIVKFPAT